MQRSNRLATLEDQGAGWRFNQRLIASAIFVAGRILQGERQSGECSQFAIEAGGIFNKEPIPHDIVTYTLQNRIERCFAKLKSSRRLATRYYKTSASYLDFIHIAAARL